MRMQLTQRPKSTEHKAYKVIVATDAGENISEAEGSSPQDAVWSAIEQVRMQLDVLTAEAKKHGLLRG